MSRLNSTAQKAHALLLELGPMTQKALSRLLKDEGLNPRQVAHALKQLLTSGLVLKRPYLPDMRTSMLFSALMQGHSDQLAYPAPILPSQTHGQFTDKEVGMDA